MKKPIAPVERVERRKVSDLIPYAKNPRQHSPEQVAQIAASMKEFGQAQLIVVDEAGEIIAGHGRLLAAEKLGWTDIAVGVAVGWTDAQKRAYRITDNQLALNSDWDVPLLQAEIAGLNKDGFDLPLLGFEDLQIVQFLAGQAGEADAEIVPPLPDKPFVRAGDLWLLGAHRLLCGDATSRRDVQRLIEKAKPHLMVTDPPYGVDYDPKWRARAGVNLNPDKLGRVTNDDRVDWRQAWALFPGDVAYCWHASQHGSEAQSSIEAVGFQIRAQIIWAKDRFALSRGDYHWQHEPCWYAVRKGRQGHWAADRSQTTLWYIPARDDSGHGHGTQKPLQCMLRPIENNSKRGDAVYDPFVGSGTTIIAAETSARRCFAMDIDPGYVQVCVERWQTFSGKIATLESTGESYEEVRLKRKRSAVSRAPSKSVVKARTPNSASARPSSSPSEA